MDTVKGFAKGLDNQNSWFYRDMVRYKILVEEGADLHADFKDGGKKLTPVIVSHGLVGDRSSHVSLAKELVSYGCVVYTLNHTDKSSIYFKDTRENPPKAVYYEHFQPSVHKVRMDQYRLTQLNQRETDISCLIDLIKEEAKSELPFIDLDKLAIVGNCLGGMTSIEMAHKSKNIKLCCALDPYFSARAPTIEESDDYTVSQPLLMLTSELYHDNPFLADYDAKKIHKKFFSDSCEKNKENKNYDLTLKDADHWNMCDISLYYMSLFKFMGLVHRISDIQEKYTQTIQVVAAFFDENDFLPVKYGKKVKDVIQI